MPKLTQSAMLFPHFLSWVIIAYVLYAFLSSEYGLLNKMLTGVGMEAVNWYNNASYWPVILVIMHALKTAGTIPLSTWRPSPALTAGSMRRLSSMEPAPGNASGM